MAAEVLPGIVEDGVAGNEEVPGWAGYAVAHDVIDEASDKLRVIEQVKRLRHEIDAEAFAKFKVFGGRDVEVVNGRRLQGIARGRGDRSHSSNDVLGVGIDGLPTNDAGWQAAGCVVRN